MSDDQQGPDSPQDQPAQRAEAVAPAPSGQPMPYGQPVTLDPKRGTDGLSIAALVTGILGLGVVPLILGILGLKRTKVNGTSGRGLSIAGIVLGGLGIVASIAVGIVVAEVASNPAAVTSISQAIASKEAVAGPDADASKASDASTQGPAAASDNGAPKVIGFTSGDPVRDAAIVAGGADEAYDMTYTGATGAIDAVFTSWSSAAKGQAWAATQDARFTPAQLLAQSKPADGAAQFRSYAVGDVATVVVTNATAAFTVTGPISAVQAFVAGLSA